MAEPTTDISAAVQVIRNGGLVVFPTETVYGLGANALDPDAVARIFRAKGRPADNPLIVHLGSIDRLGEVAGNIPTAAWTLFDAFSPGPLTIVLEAASGVPRVVTAGLPTVAIRIPRHPVAHDFLTECRTPVAAPSANRSGAPSPTTVEMARESLGDDAATYLDGGPCEIGLESTVIALQGDTIHILRPGAVTEADMMAVCPSSRIVSPANDYATQTDPSLSAASPGTRHRHYQPKARVMLYRGVEELREGVRALPRGGRLGLVAGVGSPEVADQEFAGAEVRTFESSSHYARMLYAWLTELDDRGVTIIAAAYPESRGVGAALRDRLERASGGAFLGEGD